MHTTPPPTFRCHRCGQQVRVVSRGLNAPGRYSCGHQDRLADLKASQLQPILDDALAGIVASASIGTNYLEAATAEPGQFMADLRRAMELAARADYPRLIPEPDTAAWLREDWRRTGRELRLRFGDTTSLDDDPPILFRIIDVD
jgi:hypothetical protein